MPLQRFGAILTMGAGLWAVSALVGAWVSYALGKDLLAGIVTANDVMVLLLLLPWMLGSSRPPGPLPCRRP